MEQTKKKNRLRHWVKIILAAMVITLIIKGFFFESVILKSHNMEGTLLPGDFLLINKIKHGSRTPVTLFSLPFFERKVYLQGIQLKPKRLKKNMRLKYNEIIVFNHPMDTTKPIDKRKLAIGRLIALPGDTLEIKNKQVFINKRVIQAPKNMKYAYKIVVDSSGIEKIAAQHQIAQYQAIHRELDIYRVFITKKTAGILYRDPAVKHIEQECQKTGMGDSTIYPFNKNCYWNADNLGPIIVPGKDTKNYYFVINDNFDIGKDSRHWGFVPEDHIIGTPSIIWYSKTNGKIRWDRFFRQMIL